MRYNLFVGSEKFKISFNKLPETIMEHCTSVCRDSFANVCKFVVSKCSTTKQKSTDEITFWLHMSSHPCAIIPAVQYYLGLARNMITGYIGEDDQKLILNNGGAHQAIIGASKLENYHAQYMLAYNYKIGNPVLKQNLDKAIYWQDKCYKRNPSTYYNIVYSSCSLFAQTL